MTEKIENVKVHISSDDYRAHIMKEVKSESEAAPSVFELSRMVPPGKINYFYSINGKAFINDGKKQIPIPEELHPEQLK